MFALSALRGDSRDVYLRYLRALADGYSRLNLGCTVRYRAHSSPGGVAGLRQSHTTRGADGRPAKRGAGGDITAPDVATADEEAVNERTIEIAIIGSIGLIFGLFVGRFLQQRGLDPVVIIVIVALGSFAIGYLIAGIRRRL